jgi:hypothetical protein
MLPRKRGRGETADNATLLATIGSTDARGCEFTFDEASYLRCERIARSGARHERTNRSAVKHLWLFKGDP